VKIGEPDRPASRRPCSQAAINLVVGANVTCQIYSDVWAATIYPVEKFEPGGCALDRLFACDSSADGQHRAWHVCVRGARAGRRCHLQSCVGGNAGRRPAKSRSCAVLSVLLRRGRERRLHPLGGRGAGISSPCGSTDSSGGGSRRRCGVRSSGPPHGGRSTRATGILRLRLSTRTRSAAAEPSRMRFRRTQCASYSNSP
jgi:hypothetical protein